MATNDVGKFPEHESIPGMPVPYRWWCHWKALKGTNPRRLTIPDADLRNEWIILTGGNSGIGFEAALQFVKWGANIIIGCRQPPPHEMHPDAAVEKLQAAALAAGHGNAVIEWWECDMSSFESVEAFGQRWLARDLPLHILANNAGMPEYPGRVQFTKDGFEILHQVRTCIRHKKTISNNSNILLGELYLTCPSHSDLASLFSKSISTSYHLYNFMHAVFGRF